MPYYAFYVLLDPIVQEMSQVRQSEKSPEAHLPTRIEASHSE